MDISENTKSKWTRIGDKAGREPWIKKRVSMEQNYVKASINHTKRQRWVHIERIARRLEPIWRHTPMGRIGLENALNIQLTELDIEFENLPTEFHGYKILHISDPHFDCVEKTVDVLSDLVKDLTVDLCLFSGDYRNRMDADSDGILPHVRKLTRLIKAKDGILGVLGNHDSYKMVSPFEEMGFEILLNESVTIKKNEQSVLLTGTDDVQYFFTNKAVEALETPSDQFKIALIHSPDLHWYANKNNYSLYLTGHTHGGQICLPGKIPIITHLDRASRRMVAGLWKSGSLTGYTSRGAGVVGIPARFNCLPEIGLITLKKKSRPL